MMAAQIYISALFFVYQCIYVLIVAGVATLMAVTSSQDGFHMPGDVEHVHLFSIKVSFLLIK